LKQLKNNVLTSSVAKEVIAGVDLLGATHFIALGVLNTQS
jgi:hypothetical protein